MQARAYRFVLKFVVALYTEWYQTTTGEKRVSQGFFSLVDSSYSEFYNSDLGFSEIV